MKQKTFICVLLIAILALPVFAEDMPPLTMPSVAANGFGGHHVAYTDNVFSLFVNPAAMVRTNQGSAFTIAPSLYNPAFTLGLIGPIMGLVNGGDMAEAFGGMVGDLRDNGGKLSIGFELNELPLSIGYVANGLGWGLWDRIFLNVNVVGTQLSAEVYADVMLPVGMAFKILNIDVLGEMTVDAGFVIKPFARVRETIDMNAMDFIDGGGLPDMKVPLIIGGGLDLGVMYRWNWFLPGQLSAGLTFNDIFSSGSVVMNILDPEGDTSKTYSVPFSMNFGLAYELKLGSFMGLAVALDFHNLFSDQKDYLHTRNAALDISMGAQLSLFNNLLQVRLGMNELLPSIGAGVHLGGFHIDVAYYGKELGYEPGMLPVAVLELSLSFRPDTKPKTWPWAKAAFIGGN